MILLRISGSPQNEQQMYVAATESQPRPDVDHRYDSLSKIAAIDMAHVNTTDRFDGKRGKLGVHV